MVTDWHVHGVMVGASGLSMGEARDNLEGCNDTVLRADRNAYIEGYNEGIKQYCTKTSGFHAGTNATPYLGVCPDESEDEFLIGYEVGHSLLMAHVDLNDAKVALASTAAPTEFIGSPPSREGIRHRLDTFPQTQATARALTGQAKWGRLQPRRQTHGRTSNWWNIKELRNQCETAKKEAKKLGFVADDFC